MRLIDADRLCENCEEFSQCKGEFKAECAVYVEVAAQPTIDPASLRPKGEWIPFEQWHKGILWKGKKCSCCNFNIGRKTIFKYCPNCGADMRGEKDG